MWGTRAVIEAKAATGFTNESIVEANASFGLTSASGDWPAACRVTQVAACAAFLPATATVGSPYAYDHARLLLYEFMAGVHERIASLRGELEASAPTVLESMPAPDSGLTGEAYVRSVGTTMTFRRGKVDHLYEPEGLYIRDRGLAAALPVRDALFDAIAAQCPGDSRVLNVGAGGDAALVQRFARAGHEVVSTDFAEGTVRALAQADLHSDVCVRPGSSGTRAPRAGGRDRGQLGPGIPRAFEGGSGRARPARVDDSRSRVHVRPESSSVLLQPAGGKGRDTCFNAGATDPAKLLELVRRYGGKHGLGAMAYYVACRNLAAKLALVSLLRARFASLGARCASGAVMLKNLASLTLRISRSCDPILEPVVHETPYDDADAYLSDFIQRAPAPRFDLRYIDRGTGEALARALGIHRTAREDPWLVVEHATRWQDAASLPGDVRAEVLAETVPSRYAARIEPYLAGRPMPERKPLPKAIAFDQACHCWVLDRALDIDVREADRRIDLMYAEAAAEPARTEPPAKRTGEGSATSESGSESADGEPRRGSLPTPAREASSRDGRCGARPPRARSLRGAPCTPRRSASPTVRGQTPPSARAMHA